MADEPFFIGWSPQTPKADRRAFLAGGLAAVFGGAAGAGAMAIHQRAPGPGTWDQGAVKDWRGIVHAEPYGLLRTTDLDGTPRTAFLSCLGKCGVAMRLGALDGQPVVITGSLIQRGRHAMIAVADGPDWIRADEEATNPNPALARPALAPVADITLVGEVVDTKCWFGAMRPSDGKVHKACAALCIRSGLPPAFWVRDEAGAQSLLVMTHDGAAHGPDLLPLVADPVRITGAVLRQDDALYLDAPVSAITRL